jgi:hypothetical protein
VKGQIKGRKSEVAITKGKLDFGPEERFFYGSSTAHRPKRALVKSSGEARIMAISKAWLCVCLVWATLGGTFLYLIDHSLLGAAAWLAAVLLIGVFGPFYLERLIEIIPHRGERLPVDPFFILPIASLIHGTLIGSLIGLGAASASASQAWQGALLGGIVGPPSLSVILVVLSGVLVFTKRELIDRDEAGKPTVSWPDLGLILLMSLFLPLVAAVVLIRCIVWIPRRRKRLRVYARLQELGGVFGADPDADRFYGVRLEGRAIEDADLGLLRAFSELDHVSLSGTQVTNAGLVYLRSLKRLKIIDLDRTAITDAGLVHLTELAELECLDLSETQVGDAGLECLRGLGNLKFLDLRRTQVTQEAMSRLLAKMPGLQIKR